MALKPLKRHRQSYKLGFKFRLLNILAKFLLISLVLGVLGVVGAVIFFVTQIPSPGDLQNRQLAQSTKIYDRNNELLYDIFTEENRTSIKLEDIPKVVRDATIAIEDKDFYKHQGFSFIGIARSLFNLIAYRRIEGGGSTITQQLVKNALLSNEVTFTRKLKEFILAIQVESVYPKDQILEMYLNEIPYGGTAYGIESAANIYFGKHAKDLNLAEASFLAGLPQSPSVYSPYGSNPELGKKRQAEVLRRMVEDGYITQEQAEEAKDTPLVFRTSRNEQGIKAPHFVLFVKQQLTQELQFDERVVEQGGLRVITTLDYQLQQQVEKIVKEDVEKLKRANVGNAAAVVMDPRNGHVLAMVGSKDFFGKSEPEGCIEGKNCSFEPNVNVAIALRQPGSATKPINYAVGLQKGYTAASVFMDVRTEFPGGEGQPPYVPVNYDGRFRGPVQMRYALGNSYNIPAVKMLALNGIEPVMELGFKMGLTTWEPTDENMSRVGLSLTLGGREVRLLDLVTAFSVFANQGRKHKPVTILKVTDANGKVLYEHKDDDGVKVLDEGIAFIISDILADNGARSAAFGSNSVLNIPGHYVSVKTGTTDQKKDNWAVGYTQTRTVGVWVGNNDSSVMDPSIASGITGASPIWQKIMIEAIKNAPSERPQPPSNVTYVDVDGLMGGQPRDGSPTRKEYMIEGTEPGSVSSAYQRRKVCRNNPHRLAGDGEDGEDRDVIVLQENDPTGANKWQEGIDQWVLTAADSRFVGTAVGCSNIPGFTSVNQGGVIYISNIGNGANVPRVFDVLAQVNSPFGVQKITWSLDGAVVKTQTAEPYALHVELPEGDRSSHTITVTLEDNNGGSFSHSIGVTVAL